MDNEFSRFPFKLFDELLVCPNCYSLPDSHDIKHWLYMSFKSDLKKIASQDRLACGIFQ